MNAPLALAFTAGIFAVLNPCGFAMLPAYLSTFLVGDMEETAPSANPRWSLHRAVVVSLAVTAGFTGLFAFVGLVVRLLATGIVISVGPWVSMVIGGVLVIVGIASTVGWEPPSLFPRLNRGGQSARPRSMILYGVSYATVSLSCTLPTFLVYVAGTMSARSVVDGLAVFVAYSAGFASLLTALSIGLALARQSIVSRLRKVLPFVQRACGLLLLLAGLYVAYYGWYEIDRLGKPDRVVDWVTGVSFDVQRAASGLGLTRRGWILATPVALVAIWALRGRSRSAPELEQPTGAGVGDETAVTSTADGARN